MNIHLYIDKSRIKSLTPKLQKQLNYWFHLKKNQVIIIQKEKHNK